MARTATAPAPAVHPVTGLPVQPVPVFQVGDLVTRSIGGDAYPAVVVKVQAKAVWVRSVSFVVGNVTEDSHANYLDDTTLVIDPDSVEQAVARGAEADGPYGQGAASKYVLRVAKVAAGSPGSGDYPSFREQEQYGAQFHRARWAQPGGYGSLRPGARYRQDPHF